MRFSIFEFGINRNKYSKKAGEAIDIYAAEHEVKLDVTESLVKEVGKVYFTFDVIKEAVRVGGALGSSLLAMVVKDYSLAAFGGRLLSKLIGTAGLISMEIGGILETTRILKEIDAARDKRVEKILSEAVVGTVATADIPKEEPSADQPEIVDVQIVDDIEKDDEACDEADTKKRKLRWNDIASTLVAVGISAYVILALTSWCLDILTRTIRVSATLKKAFVS